MNLAQTRLIDPVLSNVAVGYTNAQFVGSKLFPRVPVQISGGQVLTFGKEAFQTYSLRRAPGAATKRIGFGYLGDHFALVEDSIEAKVPREQMRDASVVPGIDLGTRAVNLAMRVVTLGLEVEQAGVALNAANYDANHQVALAGTSKWSDPSATPVTQMDEYKEAVRGSIGIYPNKLILGPKAFVALRNNPAIIDRFKYTSAESITPAMLANLFDIEQVIVGRAVTADDAGNFSDVWGNNAVLAYAPDDPSGMEEPSYAYTYMMEANPLVEQPYWDPNQKSWIYGVTMERKPVQTAGGAGFLIQNPN